MFNEYADLRDATAHLNHVRFSMKSFQEDKANGDTTCSQTIWHGMCDSLRAAEKDWCLKNKLWEQAAVAYARNQPKESMMLEVKVLQGELVKGTPNSAGYDLSSGIDITIPIGGQALIPVGLITQMSAGMFAMIRDRSGMAVKRRLTTRAGVIDADYPKEWCVVLVNEGDTPADVRQGERIAQAIFMTYLDVGGVILEPERTGGFGSTGVG